MLFAISMIDRPHSARLRADNAAAHAEYVARLAADMRLGGPLLNDAGDTRIGSLIVAEFADRDAVHEFLNDEPYHRAGLFEAVTVRRFEPVIEHPEVGA